MSSRSQCGYTSQPYPAFLILRHLLLDSSIVVTVNVCDEGEVESTPKSELPPALNVTTPGTTEAIARQAQLLAGTGGGYFDPHPAGQSTNVPTQELQAQRSHSQLLAPWATNRSATPASTSAATAPGHIELHDPQESLAVTRPPPHTTQSSLSIESATSTSTIRPESPNTGPQRPRFPNQALSALHTQDHGRYYLPPSVRRGGPQPHQISTFASAIASLHSSGVRTAANSPAVTPGSGLFNPSGPPSAPPADATADSTGTYASPFLHFTHTHVPKETHVADVDVDPVSGRKLINHYEVIDELGRGTHGKVKLGRDLESPSAQPSYVAIKIVERFSKRRKLGRLGTTEDKVKKEVAILKKARHPNVVALLEVIDDPSRKKVYIVLEWVERGEINWRVKGPKEIAMVEVRRFEREKSGNHSERALAEDSAVLTEVQKRLQKQKRHQLKAYRQLKRGTQDAPEFWSVEMMGDNESEESEEDRLSRMSSLTAPSDAGRLVVDTPGRRASRTPSPLQASTESDANYLSLTSEPETTSPTSEHDQPSARRPSSAFSMSGSMSGLEGTMYGPYDPVYSQTSRVASLNSMTSSRSSTEGLTRYATEVLETPLDSELEYVPVMTMEQIRVAFRDTLLGLQYLHYQGIVHRDIKPPNLLATIDNRVKISDFGVSYLGRPVGEGEGGEDVSEAEAQDLDDEAKELAKTVGTPAFYAPELCIADPTDDPLPVTKAIDVWALGVTLFCMLFARTPFVDNEFVVMRQIADEEIYLPRRRLQPVDLKPKSRPNSHSRAFQPLQNGRRHELDLVYEEIDDDLHDLMKRLLTKDPRKRITLEEVRHHPWVVADLSNTLQWLEETDPSRQSEGKKIEVSKEELNTAVVPLNLVERMRSGMKKILDRTGITRTRGQSNAGSAKEGSPAGSANSSSSTISQDARRQSMRGDESIYNALHKYREGEHPLSKSLAATPENEKHEQRYFDKMPKVNGNEEASNDLSRTPSRPSPPHRAMTIHSAAGSMRTVTQSDYRKALAESPPPSPGLPGTPMALSSPGGGHLSGIFGGPGRLIKGVRERSIQSTRRNRAPSSSRGSVEESDHHAEASIAVSHTSAAGHVHAPETLDRFTPNSSAHNSPASSRPHSVVSDPAQQHYHLQPLDAGSISRKSSTSSLASIGKRMGDTFRSSARSQSRRAPESSAEDWKRADERVRKLVREGKEELERGKMSPHLFESPRAFEGGICPTSPDDLRPKRDDSRVPSLAESSNPDTPADTPSEGISPTNQTGQLPPALVSSSSDLGSAVSMSISNPSIPSVISEASSVDPGEEFYKINGDETREPSSDDTLNASPRTKPIDERMDEGYSPDQELALDTDRDEEFDSSSDSDGGLVMSRRKSAARGHGLVVGTETPKERRGTGLSTRSKKSSRSGSNNTMKKVRTRESGDERRSLEISEE
ncbi:hypothetical protein M409DRAFT_69692 [Zasmidium cellare ATCC 36951]|uniref:non-specific serine/threonine protein kinase n=1 Tax=Zasmidium cellare ATCC 36951 TaxID=1080233 RepID=A0A6A6C6V3_ZASCE|nr:uncharacterized protein M409DRAFT_69692 [Zasmidium cellare ATCC 36951]KAF2161612.1 hypothetical protein M409DRAFT_69692 [Zasmidium cellare ATCC 36951]